MKKLLIFVSVVFISGCGLLKMDKSMSGSLFKNIEFSNDSINFEVIISRPNLNLMQPISDMPISSDSLPESLQITKMDFVPMNAEVVKASCDIDTVPHKCSLGLRNTPEKSINGYLKIAFADGSELTHNISLPALNPLETPDIAISEESSPRTQLSFVDVKVPKYQIEVDLCINKNEKNKDNHETCVVTDKIVIEKQNGEYVPVGDDDFFSFTHSKTDKYHKIIFDFDPEFYDTVTYKVKAIKEFPRTGGVNLSVFSNSKVVLLKK